MKRYRGIVCYWGPPGSGKTYSLAKWGLEQLESGRDVWCSYGFDLRHDVETTFGDLRVGDIIIERVEGERFVVLREPSDAGSIECSDGNAYERVELKLLRQVHQDNRFVPGGWWDDAEVHTVTAFAADAVKVNRRHDRVFTFSDVNEFVTIPRGSAVLVDEAPIWFDARAWARMDPRVLIRLTQIRHYGIDLRYSAIDPTMVELRLRQITFRFVEHRAVAGAWNWQRDSKSPEGAPQLRDKNGFPSPVRMTPRVWSAFDTTADADTSAWEESLEQSKRSAGRPARTGAAKRSERPGPQRRTPDARRSTA